MKNNNEINHLMIRELNNLMDYSNKINNLAKKVFISERLGKYLEELCIINFISIESAVFAQQKDIEHTGKSLADGILSLNRIASLYFNPDFLTKGIPDYYQSLFDLAKERYKENLDKYEKILESLR